MNANNESFTPHDAADYLGGIEDVGAYLEAAIDEGGDDPTVITHALGVIARSGEHQRTRSPHRHELRGPLQGAVGRWQPQFCHGHEGLPSARSTNPLRHDRRAQRLHAVADEAAKLKLMR